MQQARLAVVLGCIAMCAAAHAHHSISAIFDTTREVEIRGAVVAFNYVSPHALLVIDGIGYVKGTALSATAERWEIESSAIKTLAARGIRADTFKPGDQLIVRGAPHRNAKLRRANSSNFVVAGSTAAASNALASAATAVAAP